ncbi:hypothetical protein MGN70_011850 [Eutypa lata]|nr:hypothetical protein MGN70_011850 [Eutypa lata]
MCEGAVQALRGSVIEIGSDNGGSVSMPSACNGVYSIKPSAGRLSFFNVADRSPGQTIIPIVLGLLGSSVASLKFFLPSIIASQPWLRDPEVVPLPWRCQDDIDGGTRLSFGFMDFDGVVRPHPPIQRALDTVKKALECKGHEALPWNPPSHSRARKIHGEIAGADGSYDVFEQLVLSGEPLIPGLQDEFPDGKPLKPSNAIQVEKAVIRLKKYRAAYQTSWNSTEKLTNTGRPVDAVILPVLPSAAVIPGKLYYYTYISPANVIDHTTMAIPVTRADRNIDKFNECYTPVSDLDRKTWESYDPQIYHGAPASIQIQGRRLEEEKLLAIGQVVTDALASWRETCHSHI